MTKFIQFNCLHRFTLRGLCQESKIDSHFIGNFQHFIAGKKRFVSYLCVLFFIKPFCMFVFVLKVSCFLTITSLSLHAQSQHFTFLAKLNVTARKNLHIIVFIRQSVRPPPLALILTWTQKSAILGHAVIAACKISSRNVSNEACQSQFKPLMFLAVPVIVPH